jgi:TrmH family RNA methyltransferase
MLKPLIFSPISSDQSEIECFRSLRQKNQFHDISDFFIADSTKVVLKAIEANLKIDSILSHQEFYQQYGDRLPANTKLYCLERNKLHTIVGHELHQGVMAKIQTPQSFSLQQLAQTFEPILAIDGVSHTENIGSIARNALSLNVKNLLVSTKSGHPYGRRAVRVSMGSIFKINYCLSQNLVEDLSSLKNLGFKIIAADTHAKALSLYQFKFPKDWVLVFGSEELGVSADILAIADHIIEIPMSNSMASLNVANSSAIFLYEALRT